MGNKNCKSRRKFKLRSLSIKANYFISTYKNSKTQGKDKTSKA